MKKRIIILLAALFCAIQLSAKTWRVDELVDPFTIDSTQYVLDHYGILQPEEKDSLNHLCARLNHEADMECAIVILSEIDQEISRFALELYNQWGIGRNNRGILLLITMEDHQYHFATGTAAEGVYPDALLSRIGKNLLVPDFKGNHYFEGIDKAMLELHQIATHENYVSPFLSEPAEDSTSNLEIFLITWLFVIGYGIYKFISLDEKEPLSNVKGNLQIRKEQEYNTIHYSSNNKEVDWSIWRKYRKERVIYVTGGFFLIYIIVGELESFFALFLGCLAYSTLITTVWYLLADKQLDDVDSPLNGYAQAEAILKSKRLKQFFFIAPHIALLIQSSMKGKMKEFKQKMLSCPQCKEELTQCRFNTSELSELEQLELDRTILLQEPYECFKGHKTLFRTPGKHFYHYKQCEKCGGFTCEKRYTEITVEPDFSHGGMMEGEYRCIHCHHEEKVYTQLPKLKEGSSHGGYSSSSHSSSGGIGGSGSSGGSRGGGYSGGGGAGGSW